jgi:hypothetical protein
MMTSQEKAVKAEISIDRIRQELVRLDQIGFINDSIASQFSEVRESVDTLLNLIDEVARSVAQ